MTLEEVRPGKLHRLHSIKGDRQFQSRLATLGFVPGVELLVIQGNIEGPLLVEIKGSRMMIGKDVARNLIVG